MPAPRRRLRAHHVSLAAAALVVLALAGGAAFLLSEAGLRFVVARVIAQTGGRLDVEGASGSLASAMRFRRLDWRGPEATVTAHDVVVEWSAWALLSRRLEVRGLGASRLVIAVKPSAGAAEPPTSLALPIAVDIANVAVGELDWQAGPRKGRITGLAFGYAGDAHLHAVERLRFVSELGVLSGGATLRAAAPFAITGRLDVVGDGPLAGATLDATLAGTLPAVELDARGTLRGAAFSTHAALAPFAENAFVRAIVSADEVDLARFHETLPQTRLALSLDAQQQADAIAGVFRATNALPGGIEEGRAPVVAFAGRYAYAPAELDLSQLTLEFRGGGRATGDATVDLRGPAAPSRWRLTLHDLDLARIHASLATTRLSGSFAADVGATRQTITADLSQPSLALSFAATLAERRLDVTRLRAETHGGTLTGRGTFAIDAPRAFDATLEARHFDPSRFAALPEGSVDGSAKASGVLAPAWKVSADIAIAPESRLAGLPLAGRVRATAARDSLAGAEIELRAGGARLAASGNAGEVGARLTFALDAPRVAELRPLYGDYVPTALAGSLAARGTLQIEPGGAGGDVVVVSEGLRVGDRFSAERLDVKAQFAPGGSAEAPVPFDARRVALTTAVKGITAATYTLASVGVDVSGTLAHNRTSLKTSGPALDATALLDGGFAGATGVAALSALRWSGQVVTFENRGDVRLALTAPASLELATAPAYVRLADARLVGASGRADLADLTWDGGRLATRGTFAHVRLASVATLLERPLPLESTLTLAGEWSITAGPRLAGTFAVRRDSGDLYAVRAGAKQPADVAFGIEALEVAGTLRDDALDARLDFRSARAGSARGALALGVASGAEPGRIGRDAPLAASLDVELKSLAPLQPWLGTAAVADGSAKVALAARGTLGAPVLSGTVSGDALRVDAPQFGVALRDGRVRAHLADGGLELDELSIAGGDGRFSASGTIASKVATAGEPRTKIAWRAENFRVTNLPSLRLVVGGEGSLAIAERRLAIVGATKIVQGRIEYEASPPGRLGADVVVVGRQPPEPQPSVADLPLFLDVDVDLGSDFKFSGSGLETALVGRVHVLTGTSGRLEGRGTIEARGGTYYTFGQRLTIDRGRLIFDGPLDNPALDIVALRKNLAVEAGVELTGTVKVPRVRVTSNPPVPENEALAWLITGQAPTNASRSDVGALSAASAALLSQGGKPLTAQVAQNLGLDEISVQSTTRTAAGGKGGAGTASPAAATGQVIVFGKRITERLTVGYEQGLSVAASAVRLEYTLTRTLTLRAEAGVVSGVGIVYRRSFE